MKQIKRRAALVVLLAGVVLAGLVIFLVVYALNASTWALFPSNGHLYTNGVMTRAGSISDRDGTVLAYTEDGTRKFHRDSTVRRATLHVVGDPEGYISTGIHNAFRAQITGYSPIFGTFNVQDVGRDIRLTVSSELCVAALKALGSHSGTVAMYNYRTGEVVCMVSTPTYDITDKDSAKRALEHGYKGVYLNRCLSSVYTPGSTFKIVTAAAALETYGDAAFDRAYTCGHGAEIGGEWVSCLGNHRTVTLKDAFVNSCNGYFSQLAVDLGPDTLTKYAEKCGFNRSFSLDGIEAATSRFSLKEGIRSAELGWAGIGQYTTLANPLHELTLMGAIAGGGEAVTPYLVESVGEDGTLRALSHGSRRMLERNTADKLRALMRSAVTEHYGDDRFGGLTVYGKTGTAEVGEGKRPHAEFVGFCENTSVPLAFAVVVENAGSGNGAAVDAAASVLKAAKKALS